MTRHCYRMQETSKKKFKFRTPLIALVSVLSGSIALPFMSAYAQQQSADDRVSLVCKITDYKAGQGVAFIVSGWNDDSENDLIRTTRFVSRHEVNNGHAFEVQTQFSTTMLNTYWTPSAQLPLEIDKIIIAARGVEGYGALIAHVHSADGEQLLARTTDAISEADKDGNWSFEIDVTNITSSAVFSSGVVVEILRADTQTKIYESDIIKPNGPVIAELQKSTYQSSISALRNKDMTKCEPFSLCFLTTACVQNFGLSDSCWELEVLRAYRDNHLNKTKYGRELIQKYYNFAPDIVERINRRADRKFIWSKAYLFGVLPTAILTRYRLNTAAQAVYTRLYKNLEKLAETV